MIPNHDAHLIPPEQPDAPCRNCSHYGDDHERDGACLVEDLIRTRDFDGTTGAVTVPCGCSGYEPYTRDDWDADEADRYYDETKAGGF